MKQLTILFTIIFVCSCSLQTNKIGQYPKHWWGPVSDNNAPSWEILPQSANYAKSVILSKRNELGILSNFAHTPFIFEGKKYESIEGLWQSMKYPESNKDPRSKSAWKYSRSQVEQMIAFDAKRAGSLASKNMKEQNINWVTYKGKRMTYRTLKKGAHYQLIKKVMKAKLDQNPKVKQVLLATKNLILLPDHKTKSDSPPAWKYNIIWMELRSHYQK